MLCARPHRLGDFNLLMMMCLICLAIGEGGFAFLEWCWCVGAQSYTQMDRKRSMFTCTTQMIHVRGQIR